MPADGGLGLVGDWAKAQRIASTMGAKFQKALERAVMREAQFLRGQMVKGIASGAPGGNPFRPLSAMTLALRAADGGGGSKPLIRTGALRASITVIKVGQGRVFVGVHRSAKSADGKGLANLAALHEFGGASTHTLRQRRYLWAKLRKAGISVSSFGKGPVGRDASGRYTKGTNVGTIPIGGKLVIPARPFIRPVLAMYARPGDVKRRFYATIAEAMGGDWGKAAAGKL